MSVVFPDLCWLQWSSNGGNVFSKKFPATTISTTNADLFQHRSQPFYGFKFHFGRPLIRWGTKVFADPWGGHIHWLYLLRLLRQHEKLKTPMAFIMIACLFHQKFHTNKTRQIISPSFFFLLLFTKIHELLDICMSFHNEQWWPLRSVPVRFFFYIYWCLLTRLFTLSISKCL